MAAGHFIMWRSFQHAVAALIVRFTRFVASRQWPPGEFSARSALANETPSLELSTHVVDIYYRITHFIEIDSVAPFSPPLRSNIAWREMGFNICQHICRRPKSASYLMPCREDDDWPAVKRDEAAARSRANKERVPLMPR